MNIRELIDAEMAAYFEGEYMDSGVVKSRLRDLLSAAMKLENERCATVSEDDDTSESWAGVRIATKIRESLKSE
jgi:hypothetical protein